MDLWVLGPQRQASPRPERARRTVPVVVSPFVDSGQLHCGSYVFVRSATTMEDRVLLELLGLGDYRPSTVLVNGQRWIVVGNSHDWTVIGDDWEWLDFGSESAHEALGRLVAANEEVLLCSVSDVDDGFAFFYWRRGVLVRSYKKISHDLGKSYAVDETGTPLTAETEPVDGSDDEPTEWLWALARSLGFDVKDAAGTYRVFAGPRTEDLGLENGLTNLTRDFVDNPILGPHLSWRRQ